MEACGTYVPVRQLTQTQSTKIVLSHKPDYPDSTVVIKIVDRRRRSLSQLEREKRIRSAIPTHPNIIGLLDIIELPETCSLIEEYCPKGDVADEIIAGKMTVDTARSYFAQLMSALIHIHRCEIAHGDVKADNMLLDTHDTVKLTDFEHALHVTEQAAPHHSTGRCTGSVPYNAPEMFLVHSCDYDIRSLDMWAAGVVLYAMLTGTFPWERAAFSDRFYRSFCAGDCSLVDSWSTLEEQDKELIQHLLCFDPQTRWTAQETATWIEANWGTPVLVVPIVPSEVNQSTENQAFREQPLAPSPSIVHRIPFLLSRSNSISGIFVETITGTKNGYHPYRSVSADFRHTISLFNNVDITTFSSPHAAALTAQTGVKELQQLPWMQIPTKIKAL